MTKDMPSTLLQTSPIINSSPHQEEISQSSFQNTVGQANSPLYTTTSDLSIKFSNLFLDEQNVLDTPPSIHTSNAKSQP